jgi:hypothetical protein
MNINSKKILLMFLGSSPNTENIINHWIIMNENNLINNNIYIIIHPLCINNFKINNNFKNLFNNNNVCIVDDDHHLKTKWGSHSLTCATLLMMQYAQITFNMFFDKYVLLSPSCCPLYSINDIYDIISDEKFNNKSWFNINNILNNYNINELYQKKALKTSQWMVIDKKHIYYFFYNKYNIKTYVKNNNAININPDISFNDDNFFLI